MPRVLGSAAAAIVLLGASPLHGSAQRPQPGSLTLIPAVVETVDGRQRIAVELGRLVVPERRSDPRSRSIELSFYRLKSTSSNPGPPVIFLAGGPGVSGMRNAGRLLPWTEKLLDIGDVVFLDQRSVGQSLPRLDCPDAWGLPLDRPGSREEFITTARVRSRACADFWTRRGVDLRGYTTEESADDVDALRQALGVEKINLWGASYGSHLALSTIRRHGSHIHRAIIPAVEGPDHTIKLPSNIQRTLETIDARVRTDANVSSSVPDFLGLMREVLERLEKQPATVQVKASPGNQIVGVTVGKFDLQLATADSLGDLAAIAALPARYVAMSRGDFAWLGQATLARRTSFLPTAMSFMMDCASGISPERATRIRAEAGHTLLGDAIDLPFPDVCDAWGNPDLGQEFRSLVHSNVPVLFISGLLDGRTPLSNTEEIMAGFPNAQHLIVDGLSHTGAPLYNTPVILDAIWTHLKGGTIPATHTSIPFHFDRVDAHPSGF